MKQIKVLGSGCAKCVKTAAVIQAIADEHGVPVNLVKETSAEVMMNYGVMSTPAVVVDEACSSLATHYVSHHAPSGFTVQFVDVHARLGPVLIGA